MKCQIGGSCRSGVFYYSPSLFQKLWDIIGITLFAIIPVALLLGIVALLCVIVDKEKGLEEALIGLVIGFFSLLLIIWNVFSGHPLGQD